MLGSRGAAGEVSFTTKVIALALRFHGAPVHSCFNVRRNRSSCIAKVGQFALPSWLLRPALSSQPRLQLRVLFL